MKSNVIVRIKVNNAKHSVVGYSSFSNQSYKTKYKNAVLNAVYTHYSNQGKRFKYDSKFKYKEQDVSVGVVGKKKKHIKAKENKQYKNEIIVDREKKAKKELKNNKDVYIKDKYGGNVKTKEKKTFKTKKEEKEYKIYLKLKKKFD